MGKWNYLIIASSTDSSTRAVSLLANLLIFVPQFHSIRIHTVHIQHYIIPYQPRVMPTHYWLSLRSIPTTKLDNLPQPPLAPTVFMLIECKLKKFNFDFYAINFQ